MDATELIDQVLAGRRGLPGSLLPILHDIQNTLGYIPTEAAPRIAEELNLSRAEVHGVITYYHFFRQHPPGKHIVRICRAEACQANGADTLAAHAQSKLGCSFHETTPDGRVTLEPVFCLGQCAVGPAVQVDEKVLCARVSADDFDTLIDSLDDNA